MPEIVVIREDVGEVHFAPSNCVKSFRNIRKY